MLIYACVIMHLSHIAYQWQMLEKYPRKEGDLPRGWYLVTSDMVSCSIRTWQFPSYPISPRYWREIHALVSCHYAPVLPVNVCHQECRRRLHWQVQGTGAGCIWSVWRESPSLELGHTVSSSFSVPVQDAVLGLLCKTRKDLYCNWHGQQDNRYQNWHMSNVKISMYMVLWHELHCMSWATEHVTPSPILGKGGCVWSVWRERPRY